MNNTKYFKAVILLFYLNDMMERKNVACFFSDFTEQFYLVILLLDYWNDSCKLFVSLDKITTTNMILLNYFIPVELTQHNY